VILASDQLCSLRPINTTGKSGATAQILSSDEQLLADHPRGPAKWCFARRHIMWLITPIGFFSIVCKPGDEAAGVLTVRSRVSSDLDALRREYLPSMGDIIENVGTDYRFRAQARRDEIEKALAAMVHDLHYDNFKNEVARKQGKYRAGVYAKVWDALYDLQDRE
jgi:hypothetical protein